VVLVRVRSFEVSWTLYMVESAVLVLWFAHIRHARRTSELDTKPNLQNGDSFARTLSRGFSSCRL
jgi:hypothetical protein